MSKGIRLSKSRLLAFRQCPKRLWLSVHAPDLAEDSRATEIRFATGHQVGEIARGQFANGILIGHTDDLPEALRETREVLERQPERPVFEAAFEHEGVLVRADVMLPARGKYQVIEVKSSASVKDYHYTDCASQTWVMRESGVPVSTVVVAHIDSSFVYPGNGDYRGLFARQTVDEQIAPLLPDVPKWVAEMNPPQMPPMSTTKSRSVAQMSLKLAQRSRQSARGPVAGDAGERSTRPGSLRSRAPSRAPRNLLAAVCWRP